MGRRKYCHNIGKQHKYKYVFPSIGGWYNKYALYRCERVCEICKHKTKIPDNMIGIWTPDANSKYGYKKLPDEFLNK